jgi:hypothetical protein
VHSETENRVGVKRIGIQLSAAIIDNSVDHDLLGLILLGFRLSILQLLRIGR